MNIAIFTDEKLAADYAVQIHEWLKKYRKDYNALKWCDIQAAKDKTGLKWYVKVPPDYEVLNAKISLSANRLTLPKTGAIITEKIPDDFFEKQLEPI